MKSLDSFVCEWSFICNFDSFGVEHIQNQKKNLIESQNNINILKNLGRKKPVALTVINTKS